MRAIDTNVLVRLIAQDDSRQDPSAETLIEQGAWVSVLALAEATWLLHLARKAGHLPLGTFDRNLAKAEGAQEL